MKNWQFIAVGIATAILSIVYITVLIVSSWPIDDFSIKSASLFGDSFGFLNAFFTGGAFLLVLWTITIQQKELALQREEMSKIVSQQNRELHFDLIKTAMYDSDLMEVWSDNVTNSKEQKQSSYINLIISNWEMLFSTAVIDEHHAETMLRNQMARSSKFRDYWEIHGDRRREYSKFNKKMERFHRIIDEAYLSAKQKEKVSELGS